MNTDPPALRELLHLPCTSAVIGLSADESQPRFEVSQTMRR